VRPNILSFRLSARLNFCLPSAFSPFSGQRGITPACWIWRSSFERQKGFNPPEQRAAPARSMPLSDPSRMCMRAVRLEPSPADLPPSLATGVFEVSRFSCMKFIGVPGVSEYAGLNMDSHYRPCSCCLPRIFTASAFGL